jgi:hypothetical protein
MGVEPPLGNILHIITNKDRFSSNLFLQEQICR